MMFSLLAALAGLDPAIHVFPLELPE